MTKLILLCGLPASGKSAKAKEIAEIENALILSSDELRVELYGDVNHQDNNGELFIELYRRAKENLNNGQNVILDATNISSKRRIFVVNEFKNYHKEVYYFCVDYNDCIWRDSSRERSVGEDVLERMYRNLHVPTYHEGWNVIHIISDEYGMMEDDRENFESIVLNSLTSHDTMFSELSEWDSTFDDIHNLPQDSKWHTLSVSRHTYEVWKYTIENYYEEDKLKMLLAALFHDTGKAYCKEFKEGSRYANFISHENVSAQLTCQFLMWLGYDQNFVLDVCELVQLHMRLLSIGDSDKGISKLKHYVGDEVFKKLEFFREADEQAH